MVVAYFLMASALWVHSGGMRLYEFPSPVRDVQLKVCNTQSPPANTTPRNSLGYNRATALHVR